MLLEVLIATTIFGIVITGAIALAFGGQTSGLDVGLTTHGFYRTAATMEDSFAAAAGAWDSFDDSSTTEDIYTKSRTVHTISNCTKMVESEVGWDSEHDRSQGSLLESIVVNTAIARAMGGGCSTVPPSDWDKPRSRGSKDVSPAGPQATALGVRHRNGRRYVFLTTTHTSDASPDFWVIDATDPEKPKIVASLDTGGGNNKSQGLKDIVIAGDYAYVLQKSKPPHYDPTVKQLQIVDISDPEHLTAADVTEVGFDPLVVDPLGAHPEGETIAYWDERLYIGLQATAGSEFLIFDTEGNPASPSYAGSLTPAFDQSIFDIALTDGYAFVATNKDTSEVVTLSISNPSNPTDTGTGFNASGNEDGKSVVIIDDKLYLGRTNTTGGRPDLYALTIAHPLSITSPASTRLGISNNTEISGIIMQGDYLFVSSTDSGTPFFIRKPDTLVNIVTCALNFPQATVDIEYQDNLVFTANKSNDALRIIYGASSCS